MSVWWWIPGILIAAVMVLALASRPLQRLLQRRDAEHARRLFRRQREVLEAKFFDIASSLGKPRGVRWLECQWHGDVLFVRDRHSGLITAFVSVSLQFEAIEGGDMEDVLAVGKLRDASAVFHYQQGAWGTGGRALFNMDPKTAVERFSEQYEPLPLAATTS